MSEYLSLYDYLGKPAGTELGKKVKEYADENNIPFQTRQIDTPTFQGTVCLYPREFLNLYFREPDTPPKKFEIGDDLPF